MAMWSGSEKYAVLKAETTWNTYNAGATSLYIPYTDYGVATQRIMQQASLFTGTIDPRHNRCIGANLGGAFSMPLWGMQVANKSIAEYMLTWAMDRTNRTFLKSYSIDTFESNTDNKRHTGMRVSDFTLTGQAENGEVNLSMNLLGGGETGGVTVPSLAGTEPKPFNFIFADVQLYLGEYSEGESASSSEDLVDLRSFSLTVNNTMTSHRTNSQYPTVIAAHQRSVQFNFSVFKTANTYDAFNRSTDLVERSARLVLRCPHLGTGGTGTHSVVEFFFDRLDFSSAANQAALNDLATQDLNWMALDPATSEQAIELFCYSE